MTKISDVIERASLANFSMQGYLQLNHDLAKAKAQSRKFDLRQHLINFGMKEGRCQYNLDKLNEVKQVRLDKMNRLAGKLRLDLDHIHLKEGKFDFLTEELRSKFKLAESEKVSSNEYDPQILKLIDEFSEGLLLDCGAGLRKNYFSNVINFEIVNYWSTDILGVSEVLPFKDNSFEAVISVAVLEHVCDPFKCAAEIIRVLKPGGKLFSAIPFLQPYHGYPSHYYNMTAQGHRYLYEKDLSNIKVEVFDSVKPIFSLTWFLNSYLKGLPKNVQDQFLNMKVSDLIAPPQTYLSSEIVTQLSNDVNFELASATILTGIKKASKL